MTSGGGALTAILRRGLVAAAARAPSGVPSLASGSALSGSASSTSVFTPLAAALLRCTRSLAPPTSLFVAPRRRFGAGVSGAAPSAPSSTGKACNGTGRLEASTGPKAQTVRRPRCFEAHRSKPSTRSLPTRHTESGSHADSTGNASAVCCNNGLRKSSRSRRAPFAEEAWSVHRSSAGEPQHSKASAAPLSSAPRREAKSCCNSASQRPKSPPRAESAMGRSLSLPSCFRRYRRLRTSCLERSAANCCCSPVSSCAVDSSMGGAPPLLGSTVTARS
mmetsp:Transcript_67962/g.196886  ORF Transcript_67962/g.196886 Transcript_67962/m.196886 type:complete len:277 (-) Transcript_67962:683-1513(-)